MKHTSINKQSGAVSLFIVIFAMLLISIVTVGFLRLMINDQKQATNNDLAQSAYDSALAGAEDAKRALLRYQQVCSRSGEAACTSLASKLTTDTCNEALLIDDGAVVDPGSEAGGNATSRGEIKVQQSMSAGDELLDQAYTCVTIDLDSDDYLGTLSANKSQMVPLIADRPFSNVTIEWFSVEDIGTGNTTVVIPNTGTNNPLTADWAATRPPVLRSQLMQFSDSFTLNSFDATVGGRSNANTLFLYPHTAGIDPASQIDVLSRDIRADTIGGESPADIAASSPLPIKCRTSLDTGGYACSATLTMPQPIGGGDRNAYLRLTPFFNGTHFRVSLSDGANLVRFEGVQPIIDSTGRANDLFRRIQTRVDMFDTTFPFPEAAVDISGNFCKDFIVTDTEYFTGSSPVCTP